MSRRICHRCKQGITGAQIAREQSSGRMLCCRDCAEKMRKLKAASEAREADVVSYTRPCGHCGGTGKITSDATLDQIADEAIEGLVDHVNAANDEILANTVRGNEVLSPEMAEKVKLMLVMSEENAARFVTLAQIGISHGLWHPIEWFVNWMKHLPGLTPPEKLEEKTKLAEDVFIEFFRNTGENPGDGSPIESLDREGLYRMVNDFADEKGLPR